RRAPRSCGTLFGQHVSQDVSSEGITVCVPQPLESIDLVGNETAEGLRSTVTHPPFEIGEHRDEWAFVTSCSKPPERFDGAHPHFPSRVMKKRLDSDGVVGVREDAKAGCDALNGFDLSNQMVQQRSSRVAVRQT